MVGVCWYEARAYCNWLAAQTGLAVRLPTEVEWEAAARRRGGPALPLGRRPGADAGNTIETRIKRTTPVGVFPEGDTPEGVADLTGNVYEWTSSAHGTDASDPQFRWPYDAADGREEPDTPDEMNRVVRGGCWLTGSGMALAWHRDELRPGIRHLHNTLRVAISV